MADRALVELTDFITLPTSADFQAIASAMLGHSIGDVSTIVGRLDVTPPVAAEKFFPQLPAASRSKTQCCLQQSGRGRLRFLGRRLGQQGKSLFRLTRFCTRRVSAWPVGPRGTASL